MADVILKVTKHFDDVIMLEFFVELGEVSEVEIEGTLISFSSLFKFFFFFSYFFELSLIATLCPQILHLALNTALHAPLPINVSIS